MLALHLDNTYSVCVSGVQAITPIESIKYVGHPGSAGALDNCRDMKQS